MKKPVLNLPFMPSNWQKNIILVFIFFISVRKKNYNCLRNMLPLKEKRITAEVCVHHLHFTSDDYDSLGNQIKCNPAIKAPHNKEALWKALLDDRLDVIATDHAPHTWRKRTSLMKKPMPVCRWCNIPYC